MCHVWLAVVLIVAADRQATIAGVCSLPGVSRMSAARIAVLRHVLLSCWTHVSQLQVLQSKRGVPRSKQHV